MTPLLDHIGLLGGEVASQILIQTLRNEDREMKLIWVQR